MVFFLLRHNTTEHDRKKKGIKNFMVPSDKPYNFLQGLIPSSLLSHLRSKSQGSLGEMSAGLPWTW